MSVLFIEFDMVQYPTAVDCLRYIRENVEIKGLLDTKGFILRKCKSYQMSTAEVRNVFAWYGQWGRYKSFQTARPESSILVGIRSGGDLYTETDMPSLSAKSLKKKAKQEAKQAERDRKALNKDAEQKERREALKIKRKRDAEKKKSSATNEDVETDTENKKKNKRKREVIKKEKPATGSKKKGTKKVKVEEKLVEDPEESETDEEEKVFADDLIKVANEIAAEEDLPRVDIGNKIFTTNAKPISEAVLKSVEAH